MVPPCFPSSVFISHFVRSSFLLMYARRARAPPGTRGTREATTEGTEWQCFSRNSAACRPPHHSLLTAEGLPLRGGTSEEVNEESRQASDVRSGWTEAGPVTTKKPTWRRAQPLFPCPSHLIPFPSRREQSRPGSLTTFPSRCLLFPFPSLTRVTGLWPAPAGRSDTGWDGYRYNLVIMTYSYNFRFLFIDL